MLERLPIESASRVRQLLREPTSPRDALLPFLRETNALGFARCKAEEFADRARDALAVLPSSEFRTLLTSLADWTGRRDK